MSIMNLEASGLIKASFNNSKLIFLNLPSIEVQNHK